MIARLQRWLYGPPVAPRRPVETTRRVDGYLGASGVVGAAGTLTLTVNPLADTTIERANIAGGAGSVIFYRRFADPAWQAHVGGTTPGTLAFDPPIVIPANEPLLAVISGAVAGTRFVLNYDGVERGRGL